MTDIPFVGLHAHSVFSIFDGLDYPNTHIDAAIAKGMNALALTDHGNCNGLSYQVAHAQKLAKEGVDFKPIFGVEMYFIPSMSNWHDEYDKFQSSKKTRKKKEDTSGMVVEDEERYNRDIIKKRNHLILLAQNEEGLKNIFKLITESYKKHNYYRFPRIDYSLLKKYNKGIIAASACLGGVYAGDYWSNREVGHDEVMSAMRKTTEKMLSIFGRDRWLAELQWNAVPEQLELNNYIVELASEYDLRLISTCDSHFPTRDKWKDRELYVRLGRLGKSQDVGTLPSDINEMKYELYVKNGQDVWESYKRYTANSKWSFSDEQVLKSITDTAVISDTMIEKFLPDNSVRLPDFVIPEGKTADRALIEACIQGLKNKFDNTPPENYVQRLKEELGVITKRDFSKYFLTMMAIVGETSKVQLASPGRGSAAGSLVAYVLDITQVDPIKYDLQFSRFLREDGKDYPDIDYDVSDPMAIKELLIERWGPESVVPISNFNTLQLRSLIKDISKFYDIPFKEVNAVTGKMLFEATPPAKKKHGITAGVYVPTYEEIKEFSPTLNAFLAQYPHIGNHIDVLYGQIRSVSRHAGGVVIAEQLDTSMPIISSGGVAQTPWTDGQTVKHLAPMGFIKFDILGLASLRMIECAIVHILKRHKNIPEPTFEQVCAFYNEHLHPDVIDFDNQEVYENIFHDGRWAGVFQFTAPGAQNFCQSVQPHNLIDLAAITSIYRPGALSAKVDKGYIKDKNDPDAVEYLCPELEEILSPTYGHMIFQEQIASIVHKLGNDISLDEGNKLRSNLTKKRNLEEVKATFEKFESGCLQRGITKPQVRELWQLFKNFSGYGFNKSHAVAYCMLSFQCAWLLNYYPAEWVASFLDKEPESRKEKAINIAKSLGFHIEHVDVNKSGVVWEISGDDTLIQPLTSLKGLGDSAVEQVINNRPFANVEELLFNEGVVYSKLNKKALDVLSRSQALLPLMDERFTGTAHFHHAVVVDRPKNKKKLLANIEEYSPLGDFPDEDKIEYLVSLTGIFPFHLIMNKDLINKLEDESVSGISEYNPQAARPVWFIPRDMVLKKTRNGREYYIIHVIDDAGGQEAIKCWGVDPARDRVYMNRPYQATLSFSSQWGYSAKNLRSSFRLLA